ncbi:tyrosine-type recombinase/integrase [Vibrio fluvialis]|nr:tyrosine-type recombinase/integrase [Vibrio fluvialis]
MSRISRASISTCLRALVKHKEAQYNRGFIRRSVYVSLKSNANTLIDLIGHRMAAELNSYDLEYFFNEQLRDVERSDGSHGYKDATIKNLHNTLKQMYDLLEKQGKIRKNPYKIGVQLCKLDDREQVLPYTLDEIRLVMSLHDGSGILEGFLFACREGLRPSELIGLTENNVSISSEFSSILIDKSIVLNEFNNPKTKKSNRRICVTSASSKILSQMLNRTPILSEYQMKGVTHQERFVFVNPETKTYWQSSQEYYKSLKYYFDRAGVKFRGIQPCRHTYATTAIDSGMKIVDVADHMGHSSVDTTMKHYRDLKNAILGRKTLAHREKHDPFGDVHMLMAA